MSIRSGTLFPANFGEIRKAQPLPKAILVQTHLVLKPSAAQESRLRDGRRYTFENELPVVDIGLRLSAVQAMDLQSEPVETQGSWEKRAETLAEHGATDAEIAFLRSKRVELNAMPADVFVGFLERKLTEQASGRWCLPTISWSAMRGE